MEKDWKFLIENRFRNRDRKFSDFLFFRKFSKNRKSKKVGFQLKIFRKFSKKNWKKSKNLDFFENFENFSISILKSIFDQKFSIFFHDLFFKPLKNQLEKPHVKARSPENAMRTREKSKRADRLLCKKTYTKRDT